MTKHMQPAAVNTRLVTILAIAVLAAGIYWVVKAVSNDDAEPAKIVEQYELWCTACREITKVPRSESKNWPKQNGKHQCPKCQEWAGSWGQPTEVGGLTAP